MKGSKKKKLALAPPAQGDRADMLRLAVATLQNILPRLRNDDQNGYTDCKDGKFAIGRRADSGFMIRVTSAELDALFEVAGIVPDAVAVNGSCTACVYGSGNPHSLNQGWSRPCSSCKHPKMTNFVPLAEVKNSALKLTDDEAQFLINARDREWWAEGIVAPRMHDGSLERDRMMARCHAIQRSMEARVMIIGTHDRRITNKGLRALRLWQASKRRRTAVAS